MATVGPRGQIYFRTPDRPGNGSSRNWRRVIGEWHYSFTVVNMPNGEIRWFVRRYDTPISQHEEGENLRMKFDCYWKRVREWTFRPEGNAQ